MKYRSELKVIIEQIAIQGFEVPVAVNLGESGFSITVMRQPIKTYVFNYDQKFSDVLDNLVEILYDKTNSNKN